MYLGEIEPSERDIEKFVGQLDEEPDEPEVFGHYSLRNFGGRRRSNRSEKNQ